MLRLRDRLEELYWRVLSWLFGLILGGQPVTGMQHDDEMMEEDERQIS